MVSNEVSTKSKEPYDGKLVAPNICALIDISTAYGMTIKVAIFKKLKRIPSRNCRR
jgi:hypothetical protein